MPSKKIEGMKEDYIKVNINKNYSTKLVTSNIELFDNENSFTSIPNKIDYKIK